MLALRISPDLPEGVQRILVWCALGCSLVRVSGSWRLEPAPSMVSPRRPFAKTIQDRTAQKAISLGARSGGGSDLFGGGS